MHSGLHQRDDAARDRGLSRGAVGAEAATEAVVTEAALRRRWR